MSSSGKICTKTSSHSENDLKDCSVKPNVPSTCSNIGKQITDTMKDSKEFEETTSITKNELLPEIDCSPKPKNSEEENISILVEKPWFELDRRRVPPPHSSGRLPAEYHQEAESDLHEKQAWMEQDIQALRELLEKENDLRFKNDTAFLLTFLRAKKFDYEKANAMVVGYYRARQENQSFYNNLTASALQHVWERNIQNVLPTTDKMGRTVILFRAGLWDPTEISLDDMFRAQMLIMEHIVRAPITQLKGISVVVDCSGLNRSHVYHFTAAHIKRMLSVVQDIFPIRFKALHFVNEPLMFELMFNVVRPFMSDTIKGRLHFHGSNLSALYEHFPRQSLPKELGGDQIFDNSELVNILNEEEDYFLDHFSYGFTMAPPTERELGGIEERSSPTSSFAHANDILINSVSDVGTFFGSYYRKKCI